MKGAKIKGLKQLQAKLDRLEKRHSKAAMRKGIRAGTAVMLKAVKAETPKDEGALRKMQASKVIGKGGVFGGIVGADVAKLESDERRPSNIDYLVEYGHVTPDGVFVPPSGHMRRAAAAAMPKAEQKVVDIVTAEISKA
jgi:hypothetical protein